VDELEVVVEVALEVEVEPADELVDPGTVAALT